MKDCVHVFPDTNVFLHFPPLSQINWCKLADAATVHLVVCLQVIHELDEKKSDSRLGSRAGRAIKEIREGHQTGLSLRSGVTISVFNQELRSADFPTTLSPDSGDDRIVHLARIYREQNPGQEVAIATEDLGMELRCEASGMALIRMDAAVRLENPQDEMTKKYRQAVQESNTLKNRLPRLSLAVVHPGASTERAGEVVFVVDDSWQALDVDAELSLIKQKYPKHVDPQPKDVLGLSGLLTRSVSGESWRDYDSTLEKFYEEYKRHFELQNTLGSAKSRSFSFDPCLYNDGKALATDIDVILRFPGSIRLLVKKGSKEAEPLEKRFGPPHPPEKPSVFALGALMEQRSWLGVPKMPEIRPILHDEWTPVTSVVKNDDETFEVHAHLSKLKHGDNVRLGTFLAVFSSSNNMEPFQAHFSISAPELTECTEGVIPILVKCRSKGTDAEVAG